MKINVCLQTQNEQLPVCFGENSASQTVGFGETYAVQPPGDYNALKNKPKINSVILEGEISAEDLGLGRVYYDTTSHWNAQGYLIAERSAIYIYSDYQYIDVDNDRIPVAGLKIGDGTSYLVDMPFVTDIASTVILNHIANSDVHITPQERDFWNNKVSSYIPSNDTENLVLSKIAYVIDGDIMSV